MMSYLRQQRHFWLLLRRLNNVCKAADPKRFLPYKNAKIPSATALSFSIFTWLGFNQKLTAEDELIKTIKYCVLFIQQTEYERAEKLLHVALKQAQQIQHKLGITYIYDLLANLAMEQGHHGKAKKLFVEVSQRLMTDGATEDDPRIIHISIKLARISHLQKEYEIAQVGYEWCLNKLQKNLVNAPSDDIKLLLAIAEDWYGRLYLECNQLDHGLNFLSNALNHLKEIENIEQDNIVMQLNDIGTVYNELGKVDESIEYFKEAIKLGKTLEGYDLGTMYVNLGRVYMRKNMLEEARKSCGYGLKLGADTDNKDVLKEAQLCLKEVLRMS